MQLSDLFFWSDANNNTGLENIRGDELAALIGAATSGSGPFGGKGALVSRPGGTFIAHNVHTDVIFTPNQTQYDDLGFYDGVSKLIIPVTDPPIKRVLLVAQHVWLSGGPFTYDVTIQKNNGAFTTGEQTLPFTTAGDFVQQMNVTGGPEPVVAGDAFTMDLLVNSTPPGTGQTSVRATMTILVIN
jgi:hypothetical protein